MAYVVPKKEEDFRNRYAAETRGMPTNLAAIASRNLAIEDASIAKVNAAGRMTALPAVGSEFATPETDATSLSLAASMSTPRGVVAPTLADTHAEDIATRRGQLDSQKKQIQARLGLIPPSEAGLAAITLPNPQKRKELMQNWQMLEDEDKKLLQEDHFNTVARAKADDENFTREEHKVAAASFHGLSQRLLQIRKDPKLKLGSDELEQALLQASTDFPDGFETKRGQLLMRGISEKHDRARARQPVDRTPPEGMEVAGVTRDAEGKEQARFRPVAPELTFESKEEAEAVAGPDGRVRQAADSGGWYVEKVGKPIDKPAAAAEKVPPAALKDYLEFQDAKTSAEELLATAKPKQKVEFQRQLDRANKKIATYERTYPGLAPEEKTAPDTQATPPPPAPDRVKDKVYDTPRGKLKWTGTGWVQP